MDDIESPTTPQPVERPGAIDDATVPDPEREEGAEALIFDHATGTVGYEPRP